MAIAERRYRETLALYSPFYFARHPLSLPRRRCRAVCRAPARFRRLSCNRYTVRSISLEQGARAGRVYLSRYVPSGCKRRVSMPGHLLSSSGTEEGLLLPPLTGSSVLVSSKHRIPPFFRTLPGSRVHFRAPITINGAHRRCGINEGASSPVFSRH